MGHYDGRLRKQLDVTTAESKGRAGKFYEILKGYGFYDVSDESNLLTKEQRAQVMPENQNRMTDLANAIADMIDFSLGDQEHGMLTVHVEDQTKKLDARGAMNSSKTDSAANSTKLSGVAFSAGTTPITAPIANAVASVIQQISPQLAMMQEMFTAWSMGIPPLNLDLIPPINFGFPDIDLLGALANLYNPGFFTPDWMFMWEWEFSNAAFFVPVNSVESGLLIGCSVDVSVGDDLYKSDLFSVVGANKNFEPTGMIGGGISANDFDIIKDAAEQPTTILAKDRRGKYISPKQEDADDDVKQIRAFNLSGTQQSSLFFQYYTKTFWNPVKDPSHWSHGHWGALAHNALPSYMRTAVASFVWSSGLALEKDKSEEAALISYLLTIGLYYLIGHEHPVSVNGILGIDRQVKADGSVDTFEGNLVVRLPRSKKIAIRYFTWVADIISRFTYSASLTPIPAGQLRKRRIAEANLIYDGVGFGNESLITYGDALSAMPGEHLEEALLQRDFDRMIAMTSPNNSDADGTLGYFRYANQGQAGGDPANDGKTAKQTPTAILKYDDTLPESSELSEESDKIMRSILDNAGIISMTVAAVNRTARQHARIIYDNLQRGVDVDHRPAGESVETIYYEERTDAGLEGFIPFDFIPEDHELQPLNPLEDRKTLEEIILVKMEDQIKSFDGGRGVSSHIGQDGVLEVFDLSPFSMTWKKPKEKTRFQVEKDLKKALKKAKDAQWIKHYVYNPPKFNKDPLLHVEIYQQSDKNPNIPFDVSNNDAQPDVQFTMKNINLHTGKNAWFACFVDDYIRENSDPNVDKEDETETHSKVDTTGIETKIPEQRPLTDFL
jgi:hypothetical protein